jgi:single-strand DNA-binding protein
VRADQLAALRRFPRVYLVLDGDEAGRAATAALREALGERAVAVPLPHLRGVKDVADLALLASGRRLFLRALRRAITGGRDAGGPPSWRFLRSPAASGSPQTPDPPVLRTRQPVPSAPDGATARRTPMSPSLNHVHLIGRIGHEPDMRYLESGQCLTRFRLATDRPGRPGTGGETQEPHTPQPDWHQVVCWGQTAEFAGTYLATGRLVYVSGRLAYQTYEGRDGQRHRTVEVVAREVVPLDRPPQREAPDEDEAADARSDAPDDAPELTPTPPAPFTPPCPVAADGGGPQAPAPLPHRSPSRAR